MTLKDIKQESDKESLDKYTDEIELNEKHLSLIYDTLSDAIFLLAVEPDDRFRFVSVNLAFLAVTGLTREQVVGKRIEQVLPETAHALVIGKYKDAISDNKTVFGEEISTYPIGERVAAVTVTPVWNAEGVCTHLVGTVHDLTVRKQAEEAHRESEQRIKNLMENVPIGISISTPEGNVLEVNKALWNIFGYDSKEEFVNMPTEAHYYNSKDRERFVKLNEKGLVKSLELQFKHKDGSLFWASISSAMITTETDNTEFINTFEDITKHKRAEEALQESEGKYRSLIESSKDSIYLVDRDCRYLFVNPKFLSVFGGLPLNKVIGRVHGEFSNAEDTKLFAEKVEEVFKTGKHVSYEHRNTKDNRYVLRTLSPIKDSNGKTTAVTVISKGITERKRMEEELRESDERLRTIIDNLQLGVVIIDAETHEIIDVNPKAVSMIDAPKAEIIGQICHKYICKSEVGRCPITDLGQKVDHSEQELISAKGEIIPVLKTGVPTIFNGRRCIVDSFADITKQKRAEKELQKLNQELEQRVSERTKQLKISKDALLNLVDDLNLTTENLKSANERLLELDHLKSMFIASTSHELRTPLNSIIGFSSILLEGWEGELKPKQKEELQLIHTAGKQLLALINDIIDISKIEAGKLETDIREFGLKELIDEAVSIVKNSIDEKGLDLKMEVEDTTITSDRRRLLQCLLNLLSNAVKFTDKGMITLHATNINNMTNISIIDTGTGIMPDDIKKLFAPFVRLESSLSAKTQGTGLGLYLTKKLTEDVLDGTVGVTSEYGTGSTFTLNIPVKLEKQDKGVE